MGTNPSPLRYPGGKFKIHKLISVLIDKIDGGCDTYIEPFAGGAGVALWLLLSGIVERIILNDSDQAIASIWKAMTRENEAFLDKLWKTDVTLEEWHRQRTVYLCSSKKYSLDYGFAAFFLNRTNHSGILLSGPIGGQEQDGWRLDVRFNKETLAERIKAIGELKDQIKVYNRDVFSFVKNQLPKYREHAFIYLDPPYFRRGVALYKNFFNERKHKELKEHIVNDINIPWVVSYDDVPEVRKIYEGVPSRAFSLNYSLANNGCGKEIMFFSPGLMPTAEEIRRIGMGAMFGINEDGPV